ncbi:MAG: DNA-processing protein DprA [Candidatus Parvarchaeum sp.]
MGNSLSAEILINWFKLTLVKNGLGPVKIMKLLNYFNDIKTIFNASTSDLLQSQLVTTKMVDNLSKLKNASNENFYELIKICKMNDIEIIPLIDSRYPRKLKNISNAPLTLYAKGNLNLLSEEIPKIGVVGTRSPSDIAKRYAYDVSKKLCNYSLTLISGGALGVDTAAYKGALESKNSQAIVILGAGILRPYPPENRELFDEIIKRNGLLISENTPNFTGTKISYVQRNRIISGLADSIYLVAANSKGGGFQQVKIAYSQRKPIFVPNINKNILPNEGVKRAIAEFEARELENTEDILKQVPKYSTLLKVSSQTHTVENALF